MEVTYFLVNFEMRYNYTHLTLNKVDDQMKLLVLCMGWIRKITSSLSLFFFNNRETFIFCTSQSVQLPCGALGAARIQRSADSPQGTSSLGGALARSQEPQGGTQS